MSGRLARIRFSSDRKTEIIMNNHSNNHIPGLKRKIFFAAIVAAVLFAAGCFGFYFGWHQIKRPVFIIFGFADITESPRQADELSPSQLIDFIKALKRNEYTPVDPGNITFHTQQAQQGRNFLLTFDNFSSQIASIAESMYKTHNIRPVIFLTKGNLQDLSEVKKMADAGLIYPGLHEETVPELSEKSAINDIKPVFILIQNSNPADFLPSQTPDKIYMTNDPREVIPASDTQLLPRLKYVKGSAEAGMPDVKDWLPPSSARKGTLTVTLSLLMHFICFSWLVKTWLMLKNLRKLQKAAEKAE